MKEEQAENIRIVTPKTIYNTTIFDDPTYLWFKAVCELPSVKKDLITQSAPTGYNYQRYAFLTHAGRISAGILTVLSIFILILPNKQSFLLWLGAGAALVLTAIISKAKRGYLAQIASEFIKQNLDSIPPKATLYEISELYSEQYGVLSIVDLIWISDYGFRFILMGTILFGFSVLFLKINIVLLITVAILGLFIFWLHSGLLKKRLISPKAYSDTKL